MNLASFLHLTRKALYVRYVLFVLFMKFFEFEKEIQNKTKFKCIKMLLNYPALSLFSNYIPTPYLPMLLLLQELESKIPPHKAVKDHKYFLTFPCPNKGLYSLFMPPNLG